MFEQWKHHVPTAEQQCTGAIEAVDHTQCGVARCDHKQGQDNEQRDKHRQRRRRGRVWSRTDRGGDHRRRRWQKCAQHSRDADHDHRQRVPWHQQEK